MKVLFICRGNVGRSQMSEVIFNSLSGGKHEALSAGTQVGENEGQKIGDRPSATHVISVLDEIGIDARGNIRRQLTENMVHEVDVVVSMAEKETLPDFLKNHPETIYWNLLDPFEQSLEFTRNIRNQTEKLVKELLVNLG